MSVKFHKNCENTGKIQKISCVRRNFVKFDVHFPMKIKITQFPGGFRLNYSLYFLSNSFSTNVIKG